MSAVSRSIFRAYDIRGVVDETLTPDVVRLIGRAYASEAAARKQRSVVVGRDGRLTSRRLVAALTDGLRASGMDVIDVGEVPTPVVYFAAHYLNVRNAIAVTGSHNPAQYNGLKLMLHGTTLHGPAIQHLRARVESKYFTAGTGALRHQDVVPAYIGRVARDVQMERPLKIAIDCGNGVSGNVAPALFRTLGCEVKTLYCEVDGRFPHHHPNPSKPENMTDLIGLVQSEQADLGIAFDGDADRLGVVDDCGNIIWPDRLLMLYAQDILQAQPGATVIYDIKSSRHLHEVITEHGGRPLMWKTGHSMVKAKLEETGAVLAGEFTGHVFFNDHWYGFDDALYAAARLLAILSRDTRRSSEGFAALPDSPNTPELTVSFSREGDPFAFMDRFMHHARFANAAVTSIDGLRVDYGDGWGLIRASNTTPSLVLRFEAEDDERLAQIQDEFRRQMLEVDPGLDLPF